MENKEPKREHIINVELIHGESKTLHYVDAILAVDNSTKSYVIDCIMELPLTSEENSEKGYFNVLERIPFDNVARIYTLNPSK